MLESLEISLSKGCTDPVSEETEDPGAKVSSVMAFIE